MSGTLRSTTGSSVSRQAGSILRAAFLLPLMVTLPCNLWLPSMTNCSRIKICILENTFQDSTVNITGSPRAAPNVWAALPWLTPISSWPELPTSNVAVPGAAAP